MKKVLAEIFVIFVSLFASLAHADEPLVQDGNIAEPCVIEEALFAPDASVHITFSTRHAAGRLDSAKNQVQLRAVVTAHDRVEVLQECTVGTFVSQPGMYEMSYGRQDKPERGHDVAAFYRGTPFEGLTDSSGMFAASGKEELLDALQLAASQNTCWRYPANFAGSLDRDDNFWTFFCPRQGLVDYVTATIRPGDRTESNDTQVVEATGLYTDDSGRGNATTVEPAATTSLNARLVQLWQGGQHLTYVDVSDDEKTAYLIENRARVVAVDVDTPGLMRRLGTYAPDNPTGERVRLQALSLSPDARTLFVYIEKRAQTGSQSFWRAIDVTDPAAMRPLSGDVDERYLRGGALNRRAGFDYAHDGQWLFAPPVNSSHPQLQSVKLSKSIDDGEPGGLARSLSVGDSAAVRVSHAGGLAVESTFGDCCAALHLFDISAPESPRHLTTARLEGSRYESSALAFSSDDRYVYVLLERELHVFEVSGNSLVSTATVSGFAVPNKGEMFTYPLSAEQLESGWGSGRFRPDRATLHVAGDGKHLLVARPHAMWKLSLLDPARPRFVSSWKINDIPAEAGLIKQTLFSRDGERAYLRTANALFRLALPEL